MARILPLCMAFLASLQQVCGHSTREGEGVAAGDMKCIYYNAEYVNCTWKRNEEAAHGANNIFYYWFLATKLRNRSCHLIEENQSEHFSCGLLKKIKANNWLCLYIKTSNNFTVLALNCFKLQDHGPHRLKTDTSDLNCTLFDAGYLNCTWEQGKDAMPNISYEVYYWLSRAALDMKQCSHYLKNRGRNIGCHLTKNEIGGNSKYFYTYVDDFNHFKIVKPHAILLQDHVKMNPPQKLNVTSIGKEEVLLTWDAPWNPKLQYEMGYKTNMDSDWQVKEFGEQSFTLPSVDPAKCYFFHLRCKIDKTDARTSYWSEWGPTLIWKGNTAVDSCPSRGINALFLLLLPVAVLVFAVLVIALYQVKRVKAMLIPGIPDPKHRFRDLFEEYNGNFQEWIGVTKDLSMDFQSNCIPIECQIEEEPVRQEAEQEDPQLPLADQTGNIESVPESINEENKMSAEYVPNSQLLVRKTTTIDMSKVVMNENMYIRL